MKKPAICIGLLAYLLSLFLATGVTQAKDLNKQVELLASCQKIQQYLTLSPETSAEQRALVAVTLAAVESKGENPPELSAALHDIRGNATYLLMSDTSYYWGSDAWVGTERSIYTYDSGNRQTNAVYDASNGVTWTHAQQNINTYDGSGKLNTATYQVWESSSWVNEAMETHTYDSDGNLTQVFGQAWSGTVWDNSSKWTATYSAGRVNSIIIQIWWSGSSTWQNSIKYSYTYDGGGRLIVWLMQTWGGSVWTDVCRYRSFYYGSGDELQSLTEMWQDGAWVNGSKTDYMYDGSHHEILAVTSVWDAAVWVEARKDTSKYAGGLLTEEVEVNLLAAIVSRTQYAYDAYGNNTVVLDQQWDEFEERWTNVSRFVHVYEVPAISCGDFDASGGVDIADVVYQVTYIFSGGPAPADAREGDVNCDLSVNIADIVYLINYIFRGGPAPCEACP